MTRSRLVFVALACALLGCTASQAGAQPAPAAAAADSDRLAKALKLAQTVQPREIVVDQSMRTLDAQAVEGLLADPNIKQMESENPGIVEAMWTAARPIIAEVLATSLPDLWNGLAGVYTRHFTSAQLDQTIRFFQSPTGRKFIVEMNRNVDVKPMMRDAARDGGGDIGRGSYMQTVTGAANATAVAMSPAEIAELKRFLETPAGRALAGIGPEVTGVILAWSNRKDPEVDARVSEAMIGAVRKFMDGGGALRTAPPAPGAETAMTG